MSTNQEAVLYSEYELKVKDISGKVLPTAAIVFYTDYEGISTYAESFVIEKGMLVNGIPLAHNTMSKLCEQYLVIEEEESEDLYCKGDLPKNLISMYKQDAKWIREPKQTTINYQGKYMDVFLPSLVFTYRKGILNVKVKIDDKFYAPPFPNCSLIGDVCLGSVKMPKDKQINKLMDKIETLFFLSKFNHEGSHTVQGITLKTMYESGKILTKYLKEIK